MNNYYETESTPSCGIGRHPGTHLNGKCTHCDAYPRREAEAALKRLAEDIPPGVGKHRANTTDPASVPRDPEPVADPSHPG